MLDILITLFTAVSVASTESAARIFITAPNIFHLGVEETISVITYNVNNPVNVTIVALEYPGKFRNLGKANGIFTSEEPGILKLKLDPDDFPVNEDDISTNRYVSLVAKTNNTDLAIDGEEVKVLVSFSDGIVLLQTDKPIYTPQHSLEYTRVKIRIMPLGFDLKPAKDKKVTVVVKNPQDVAVQRWKDLTTETGFITRIFGLSEFALIGNWTILAFHGHQNSQNTSVKFEVKEYVLPKFSVKILAPKYVLPDAKDITISVQASYTYGKGVEGSVHVKTSLVGKHRPAFLVDKPEAQQLEGGKTDFVFRIDDIKAVPGLLWFPEGRRFQVEADVIEKASGKKESAIDNGIYFVRSPFKIEHQPTAEYFKPTLPFLVKVDVFYPDKKPARGIPVSISVKGTTASGKEFDIGKKTQSKQVNVNFEDSTNDQGRAAFVIDTPTNANKMKIRVETNKGDISEEHNTFVEFEVNAFNSPSRTFLYLRATRDREHVNCDVFVNKNASKITLMVIARGKILYQQIKVRSVGVISGFRFRILPEMSPSSRLVAFFVGQDSEVIADSTLLKINNGLPNKIEFRGDASIMSGRQSLHPGIPYKIQLSATPGTRVGLLAVDQSVYLLRNRDKLNKKKVLNKMDSLDLGCGVGAGRNSEDVFFKAGTVVITNADVNSRGRTEFGCQQRQQRKKRSTVEDPSPCCNAGFRPARASCLIRAKYWYSQATQSCKNEFLRCCFNATGEKDPAKTQVRSRKVHQSELTFVEEDISQGQTRKYFPETWIFTEDNVGDDGIFHLFTNLPHSITTWVIQAVGVSNHTGLGLARPLYIRAFQHFFVSLRVPYSVQRGEQISVIATVFNYGEFNTKVKIKLVESKEFCTYESTDKTSANLLVSVKSNDAVSVSFPIVPIKLGRLSIKVRAEALFDEEPFINDVIARDEVLKSILVLPEGVERRTSYSFVLDPQGILRDEKTDKANSTSPTSGIKHDRVVHNDMQIDSVLLAVPARAIPGSLSARLSLTGNLIGPAVSTLISGGLENLLRMPMGCGEQTMMFLAPNVYVLQYLSKTKQVTADIESRAYEMIQSGYQRALNYRRTDKSFSAFGESRPGSTWLTAFATRVFCAAGKFDGIEIDEALVCDSVSWILDNQRLDGAFPEVKDIIHKSMMGGIHGDVAMTAFVLVALLECGCNHQDRGQRIQNAVSFLETELNDIHKVNILSLTTYALALTGSTKSDLANRKLLRKQTNDKGNATRHWDAGDTALSVETTAYALLAQMALGRLKSAGPIVTWLSSQRDPQGGFVSTQDTCVALQALSKYSGKTAGAKLDLRVSISSEKESNWKRRYYVDARNALELRQEDITHLLGGQLFVDSSGTGVGQLQIEVRHNIPAPKNETCHFAVSIKVREEIRENVVDNIPVFRAGHMMQNDADDDEDDNSDDHFEERGRKGRKCRKNPQRKKCRKRKTKHLKPKMEAKVPDALQLKVCARYLKPNVTGMTIMDIGVFSGFIPDEDSLIELMENVKPTVDRFEISDRSVILYVSQISSDIEFCAKFTINRMFHVGTVQPVPVKIYDYYKPDDSCTEFYSPKPRSALLAGVCEEGHCRCSQDDCTPCIDRSFNPEELVEKICHESVDFAVVGELVLIDEVDFRKQSWITFEIKLNQILKKGNTDLRKGDFVEFKRRSACACPELTERKEFLIMGREEGSFFIFDEKSIVIPWVKKRKSSNSDIRARIGIDFRCSI
ncbi:complement C3-like isoform X1 [Acropora palmata]|uniref:complement C3-like isoform X1 n=1 Tax=Acropora palmata TaxID=6131 RepID=UPI003DA0AA1E